MVITDPPSNEGVMVQRGWGWVLASSDNVPHDPSEHCPTRDVFTGRLDHARILLERAPKFQMIASELIAAVGEIGNNTFDHNIGQWRDVPGCWFGWMLGDGHWTAVIADRGQGILATLRRIRPELHDDMEALRVAFREVISGRSPEQRGNGLKFVASVIGQRGDRQLEFHSGAAQVVLTSPRKGRHEEWSPSVRVLPGTLAILSVMV